MRSSKLEVEPNTLSVRLALGELFACRKVIEKASVCDSALVKTWARSTIPNALYAMTASDQVIRAVDLAHADTEAFGDLLAQASTLTDEGTLVHQRAAAVRSVQQLIDAIRHRA